MKISTKKIWTKSIARQLMLGIALVHAVLMTLFVVDLVRREKSFLVDLSRQQAFGLAETLAANATSWLLAQDIIGMEEIIQSPIGFPGLKYAMLVDTKGKVLAYTDIEQVGKYVEDAVSKTLLKADSGSYTLLDDANSIDVAAPIVVNGRQIGWSRVGISREGINHNLRLVIKNGLLYTLVAILVGTIFAWFISRGLTTDIRKLVSRAQRFQQGERDIVFDLDREDELGDMAENLQGLNEAMGIQLVALQREIEAKEAAIGKRDLIERKLRKAISIIDNSYAVAVRWKNETGWPVEYVSKNVVDLCGYAAESFISGQVSYAALIHPDDLDRVAGEVNQNSSNENITDFIHEPYRIISVDGSIKWLEDKTKIIRDERGQATHFEGILQDISSQIKAQETATALEKRLRQAQKMEAIGTLAGGIAHDFNNILGAIIGYAELAKEAIPPDKRLEEYIEQVILAGERATALVHQILAFSRQNEVERILVQMQPLLKEGLKLLRSSIPTTISITTNIDMQTGAIVADPGQVHQILMNLCTNASQAMEDTGGILSVSLKTTFIRADDQQMHLDLAPGEYAELTVSDTGNGIGADIIGKIFDPFFTTKDVGRGTGMGLAIVHGIISDYGGTITVESQLGQGTIFHVYFPVAEKKALATMKKKEKNPQGNERILFVDDEEVLIKMGKAMLEKLGYRLTIKQSSLEALETFRNHPNTFDLVVTDQTMPDLTGFELAREMLRIRPDLPIILCTGYSVLVDQEVVQAHGIKDLLFKPLTQSALARVIRQVLEGGNQPVEESAKDVSA